MSSNDHLEVEVKFFTPDLATVRTQLLAVGGQIKKPRVFERNVRYDTAWNGLRTKGALLRLRQDAKAKITFKGVPKGVDMAAHEARVREELEIEVSDFETAHLLIQRIGFEPKQTYEKYRETIQLGDVEAVLDEMPYGNFIELEGTEPDIKAAADLLNLDWSERILTNYLGLLAELNKHHKLKINDLTFANFEGLTISVGDILDK